MDAVLEKSEAAENERLVLDMVDKFLEAEVKPHVHALEHDDVYPAEIVEKMKEMGLFGCIIAPEYGGLGLSTSTYAKIVERMAAVWMSISGIVNSHLIMAMVVQRNGTEEQKTRFLPRFATGELRGGIGLTEPDCGTDLQAIRTAAKRVGNDAYARANRSFGLTTLHDRHVEITGMTVSFDFRGKAGKRHRVRVADRRLARIVRNCRDIPGYELFQYVDQAGTRHRIDSADVNAYLREIAGTDFTTFIKRSELARDRNDQRPERFAVGEKVDARVIQFDKKARKVQVSIKALEVAEQKEAIAQYGSSDSGATLGDILGTALKNRGTDK